MPAADAGTRPDPGPVVLVAGGDARDPAWAGAGGPREIAHALLRRLAAEALGCEPSDVAVGHDPAGRPVILASGAPADLRASVAHAGSVAVAAVAVGCAVGVDVEPVDPRRADLAAVARFLDEPGAAALRGLDEASGPRAIALAWTRLEAEAKGRGVTLDRLRGRPRTGRFRPIALPGDHVGTAWTDR